MLKCEFNKKLYHFTLEAELSAGNEIVVLVGPSGSGKTTLMQCIAGLKSPSEGWIHINDHSVYSSDDKINIPCRERKIGYVFQEYALFPHMSVFKNIMYGVKRQEREKKDQSAKNILEMLGILHLQDRYPQQISGGEKQRVALARALMTEPEIMLLDEPLSALDQDTRKGLQQELKNIQARWKIPFIMVTHDLNEAEFLGDQIIRIEQGKLSCLKERSLLREDFVSGERVANGKTVIV